MNPEQHNEEIEVRLWDYIDGLSGPDEKSIVEQLILSSAEWKAKYNELLEVHQMINTAELEQPSLRFTKNVMEEIARIQIAPAATNYINKKVILGIALFFFSVIAGFLIYGFSQINWDSGGSGSSTPFGLDLKNVDYSKMFNNTFVNVFMMMNIVLGLMLLDRYLSNKKRQLRIQHGTK